jgi:hypothetical protein
MKPLLRNFWYLFSETQPKKVGFYWIRLLPFPDMAGNIDLSDQGQILHITPSQILDGFPLLAQGYEDQILWMGPLHVPELLIRDVRRIGKQQAARFVADYYKECNECEFKSAVNVRSMRYFNGEASEDCKQCHGRDTVFIQKKNWNPSGSSEPPVA